MSQQRQQQQPAVEQPQQQRSLFSIKRETTAVARVDPAAAVARDMKLFTEGEINEAWARQLESFEWVLAVLGASLNIMRQINIHHTSWVASNQIFITSVSLLGKMLSTATIPHVPLECKQDDCSDAEKAVDNFTKSVKSFVIAMEATSIQVANLLGLIFPIAFRSNVTNEEAGISMVR